MKRATVICEESTLFKHSGTIHISNDLTLVERKIYNILLKHAFNLIDKPVKHQIHLDNLKKFIGREGNKFEDIKIGIKKLVKTSVEWNILRKDNKNEWGITTFLGGANIKNNICTYSYSLEIIEFLRNPNIYARLDLLVQKEFRNKYALILWEFLIERLSTDNKNYTSLDVNLIKKILGVENISSYQEFKVFNRNIIKKAVDEINKLSDIEVKTKLEKKSRKVIAILFYFRKKDQKVYDHVTSSIQNSTLTERDIQIFNTSFNTSKEKKLNQNKIENNSNIRYVLNKEFKISEAKAQKLIEEYKQEDIEESLIYVRDKIKFGFKITNIAAYTTKAIKEGWMQTDTVNDTNDQKNSKKMNDELKAEAEEYIENLEDEIKSESWYTVWTELRSQTDIFEFRNWLSHLKYENEEIDEKTKERTINLYVYNNSFIQKELQSKYAYKILQIWKRNYPKVEKLEIGLKRK